MQTHNSLTNDAVSHCEHCGKVESFNVLCPACEELCCNECGRVDCVCSFRSRRRVIVGLVVVGLLIYGASALRDWLVFVYLR